MKDISKKTGITFGCLLAAYYFLVNVIVFFADYTLFAKPYLGFVNMVMVLVLGVSCIWITKRRMGNLITTKEGFTAFFIMVVIGLFVNQLTQFILFNVVNPEAKVVNNQILVSMAESIARDLDAPAEEVNKQI